MKLMKSKHFVPIITFFILMIFASHNSVAQEPSQEKDYTTSLKKYTSKRGARCIKCSNYTPNSYTAVYRNVSTENIDAKFAVQEANKEWRTFLRPNIAPKDTVAVYACDGTGKSLFWARKAGDTSTEFPTDAEINKEYKK
jgi:hypothetical protein